MSNLLKIANKKWQEKEYEEADYYFLKCIEDSKISLGTLREVLRFYEQYNKPETIIRILTKLLLHDFNKSELNLYLRYIKDSEQEAQLLKELVEAETFFDSEEGVLLVCERLMQLKPEQDGYVIALHIAEQWAEQRKRNRLSTSSVVRLELLLVEYEYNCKYYRAARNRLRHLFSASIKLTPYEREMAYWAMLLDVLDLLTNHRDFKQILSNCPVEYGTFIHAYRFLVQGKVESTLLQQLEVADFADEALNQKAASFVLLLQYVLGKKIYLEDLERSATRYEDDVYYQLVLVNIGSPKYDHLWRRLIEQHGDLTAVLKAYALQHSHDRIAKLEGISIRFLGGGDRIGGTGIVIEYQNQRLLLDAGMFLDKEDYLLDFTPLLADGGSVSQLDGVVVSHAHLDHTGSLPYIKKHAPQVPIYMTQETHAIFGQLIRSVIHRNQQPYFNEYDLICTEDDVIKQSFEKPFIIAGQNEIPWRVTLYEAGHVVGAAAIHIEIDGISILFTGDYTFDVQRHCQKLKLPQGLNVDLLITESTYGYRPKINTLSKTAREKLFVQSLEKTLQRGGSFLVPAFSLGRAQEVLEILLAHYSDCESLPFNLIVDGNVVQMSRTYNRLRENGNDLLNRAVIASNHYDDDASFQQFYDVYVKDGGACIIASSGMLHKGSASYQYAKKMLPYPQHTIAMTGYLDSRSPANAIYSKRYQKGEIVQFGNTNVPIEATIGMHHFSAHVMQDDLVQFILDLKPSHVILMHGEHGTLYNPYNATEEDAQRLYLSVDRTLKLLKVPYTLAENGKNIVMEGVNYGRCEIFRSNF